MGGAGSLSHGSLKTQRVAVPEGILHRPALSVPIEIYTMDREQEFDAAEQELNDCLTKESLA
jgi:hypothetical protein